MYTQFEIKKALPISGRAGVFGSPSATLFITFSIWQANANQLEFINFLNIGLLSPEETYLRTISSISNHKILSQREIIKQASAKALARSVLQSLISVYVYMRNRLPAIGTKVTPAEHMAVPVTEDRRHLERQELRKHVTAKAGSEQDQLKLDRLNWVIRHHGLDVVTRGAQTRAAKHKGI